MTPFSQRKGFNEAQKHQPATRTVSSRAIHLLLFCLCFLSSFPVQGELTRAPKHRSLRRTRRRLPSEGKGKSGKGYSSDGSDNVEGKSPTDPPTGSPSAVSGPSTWPPALGFGWPSPASTPAPTTTPTNPPTSGSSNENTSLSGRNETPSRTQDNISFSESTAHCAGTTPTRVQSVWFEYAITMESTNEDLEDAQGAVQALEPKLQSEMYDLLACDSVVNRKLASDFGIVGIDYFPVDQLEEKPCNDDSSLPCFVYRGEMDIYLDESGEVLVATAETRRAIFNLMSEEDALTINKVSKIEYLGPPIPAIGSVETSSSGASVQDDDSPLVVPVLSALGALLLFTVMFATYRRKRESADKIDDTSTLQQVDSHITTVSSCEAAGLNATPFAAMLPSQYKTRQPNAMGAILEDSMDSSSHACNSDIAVSEGGYSYDESSRDQSDLNSMLNEDPILGAREMDDMGPEEDIVTFEGEDDERDESLRDV